MKQMKKFLLMLFVAVVPMTLATSCSDDDDDNDVKLAEAAAGKYTGTFAVDLANPPAASRDTGATEGDGDGDGNVAENKIEVTLTKTGEAEVKIAIGDLTVMGFTVKIDDLAGVKLTGSEDNIAIDQKVKTKVVLSAPEGMDLPAGFDEEGMEIEITYTGTIKDGKNLELNCGFPSPFSAMVKGVKITATK